MQAVRWVLGRIILFLNAVFSPRGIVRHQEAQRTVDAKTRQLILYQFAACPFCVKVRRVMKRLSLRIETRDAKNDQRCRQELLDGGGRYQVPCLKIVEEDGNVRWLYESGAIARYLEQRFATLAV